VIEVRGNLWELPATWRGITTNGMVKRNGECVMGRGCAFQAKERHPEMPRLLGTKIKSGGNNVYLFPTIGLFSFPVKHAWMDDADLVLIASSARQLRGLAEDSPNETFLLPRPGCGNGRLEWAVVKPLLLSLPDNVSVVTI
jgi:hypothetical protein